MPDRRAIVTPVRGKNPPETGAVAILAATQGDLELLARLSDTPLVHQRPFYMSTLRVHADDRRRFSLVGPLIGAPYAAMLVETLGVWGVERILFFGWCGAVSDRIHTGDILVPDRALVDEGTSGHYGDPAGRVALPDHPLTRQLRRTLTDLQIPFHTGAVWTTDAIFRETVGKVKHYQKQDALAVEMELSAIFTVATYRQMAAAGILVVSDEVSDYQWRPGFKHPSFSTARRQACLACLAMMAA